MPKRIVEFLSDAREFLSKANENHFGLLFLILTIVVAWIFAPGRELVLMDIIVLKMVYVAILLSVMIGFLFFLRGTRYDVMKEIFEENNSGAAVFVIGVLIALSMVIGK